MGNWRVINNKIRECRASDNPIECLEKFFKATADGMVAYALGEEYEKIDDYENAIKYYTMAYTLFPKLTYKNMALMKMTMLMLKPKSDKEPTSWNDINAKIKTCLDSENHINCLEKLFEETRDGMVAFKLGEGYEKISDYNKAKNIMKLPMICFLMSIGS